MTTFAPQTVAEAGLDPWQLHLAPPKASDLLYPILAHINAWTHIEIIRQQLITVALGSNFEKLTILLEKLNPNSGGISKALNALLYKELPVDDADLLRSVWGENIIGLVGKQRHSFAHWIWAKYLKRTDIIILMSPSAETLRTAKDRDLSEKLMREKNKLPGLKPYDGSLAWVYTQPILESLQSEAYEALVMARKSASVAMAKRYPTAKSIDEKFRTPLREWSDREPLQAHRMQPAKQLEQRSQQISKVRKK